MSTTQSDYTNYMYLPLLLPRIHLTAVHSDQMRSHPSLQPMHSSTVTMFVPSSAEAGEAPKGLDI